MPTLLAYHTSANGIRVHRTDEARFPYDAYHVYCSPGNGKYIEEPFNYCDEYSNPQGQEILQILPHPVWGEYVYPTTKGEGWIGDPRTWQLDVGRLSQSLYFYQVQILAITLGVGSTLVTGLPKVVLVDCNMMPGELVEMMVE
ncbi:hypothetical protein RND71_037966 [Anisodus tanguticus]|uniref:DUF7705 domain-containing protein n=1 Tax=Anisodus tanguticus TaxID=243964 RepID=A0AAE1QYU5_9SOLA|nr:hypothetical protein RND71_037966 [Anisodus tanguticus]